MGIHNTSSICGNAALFDKSYSVLHLEQMLHQDFKWS